MKLLGDERASITLWVLGLCVMMLFIGGIALDLWRAFSERRVLAGIVDAAAVAGSNAVDVEHFRTTGEPRLDPGQAEELALENLAAQDDVRAQESAEVVATAEDVSVSAVGRVDFTLLRIFMGEGNFTVTVQSSAEPRRSE